ncbi:UNVERIFIED_CONTAM: hypothetical protein GTU68_060953, partial [Idotea baltica]|nr:hypothetical protein [Idotea baltica]
LVVEDEDGVRDGIVENLRFEGYDVIWRDNGDSGVSAFESEKPDLVILDVMMPGIDGLEVCRQIRLQQPTVPIIMLTAKCSEIDKVLGLELGADDYLTKPFGMRELFARVKALLRRSETKQIDELSFGAVEIDFRSYRALKAGAELLLSAREFELIRYLAAQPDIAVTRNELLDQVWGYDNYPSTRTVDNFIARLRHKIEDSPDKPEHILTVHGVGYKFVA